MTRIRHTDVKTIPGRHAATAPAGHAAPPAPALLRCGRSGLVKQKPCLPDQTCTLEHGVFSQQIDFESFMKKGRASDHIKRMAEACLYFVLH